LIIRLTGSSPKSSLEFFISLSFIQLKPHIHLIMLISVQFNFMLYFHMPGLTAMHQTTPRTSSAYQGMRYLYLSFQF